LVPFGQPTFTLVKGFSISSPSYTLLAQSVVGTLSGGAQVLAHTLTSSVSSYLVVANLDNGAGSILWEVTIGGTTMAFLPNNPGVISIVGATNGSVTSSNPACHQHYHSYSATTAAMRDISAERQTDPELGKCLCTNQVAHRGPTLLPLVALPRR